MSHARELVLVLATTLALSIKLSDFVGLVLGASDVNGVHRDTMVGIVPRNELAPYVSRAEARLIPPGQADALPVFVKNRGECHAFLRPFPDQLRRPCGATVTSATSATTPSCSRRTLLIAL